MKCEECKAFIRYSEDGGICAFTDIGIVKNEDGTNCRKGQIVASVYRRGREDERKRIVRELEEEREEILNSNDYENEIINWCLDEYDKAIVIVGGGENEQI